MGFNELQVPDPLDPRSWNIRKVANDAVLQIFFSANP
jgi:hypothetical protein